MSNYKTEKNIDASIKDGAAYSAMVGFGESYINPYVIYLGATDVQISMIWSIPRLIGAISQLFSTRIVEIVNQRKAIIATSVLLQVLTWIPILTVLFTKNIWSMLAFLSIYWFFGSIASPVWNSMIGDIVPDKIKGRVFGNRNRIMGISQLFSFLAAGIILHFFIGDIGFLVIFSTAMLFRIMSFFFLSNIDEPFFKVTEESKFSFYDFLKKMNKTNYGLFVIYLTVMTLSVNIASPFVAVYLLRSLELDIFTYALIISVSAVTSLVFAAIWGRYSDIFGNKKILSVTGYMIPFIPILYLYSPNPLYIALIQVFSGIAWSGFNLASFNFIFDNVTPPKRVRAVSYYNVLTGLAVLLGASLGGYIIRYGYIFLTQVYLVFIISGVFRFLTSFILIPMLREVKDVKDVSEGRLLWSLFSSEIIHRIDQDVLFIKKSARKPKKLFDKIIDEINRFMRKIMRKRK